MCIVSVIMVGRKVNVFTDTFYRDSVGARTLSPGYYADGNAMTEESCINYCAGLNYIYAGVEYSTQCCMSKPSIRL
jgi:WSC domain